MAYEVSENKVEVTQSLLLDRAQELCVMFKEIKEMAKELELDTEFNQYEGSFEFRDWNSSSCYGEDEILRADADSSWVQSSC
ncbi:hypothetical protein KNT64_gp028 [Pseudomonas phage PspYZU05]|uniref:Uncharacterized protein n=1 Tax=Pseudomonas phage PspYZU05 TaxID=1983556 RepID=A0A2U7N2D0_9CAUD|nr:hypothetical protein KNT64_gp028 [Pseudomonas phage PspYZU05]ASD51980.1 hypothetical protein PspYZU05_28 [Pseudomonas phage PspYZU05]